MSQSSLILLTYSQNNQIVREVKKWQSSRGNNLMQNNKIEKKYIIKIEGKNLSQLGLTRLTHHT
jgi:hypothetical protein